MHEVKLGEVFENGYAHITLSEVVADLIVVSVIFKNKSKFIKKHLINAK